MRRAIALITAFAVKSLTPNQLVYMAALKDPKVHVVIATGMAGTGKTMIACTEALEQVRSKNYDRVIITRPTVGVPDNDIGFLPGSIDKKMAPWLFPMVDYISNANKNIIQVVPIGFMRGYTLRDSFIIVDECQNVRPDAFRMILSRLGQGSKLVFTGDLSQSDLRGQNGLSDFLSRLNPDDFPDLKWIQLQGEDCKRHPMIPRLMSLYDSFPVNNKHNG